MDDDLAQSLRERWRPWTSLSRDVPFDAEAAMRALGVSGSARRIGAGEHKLAVELGAEPTSIDGTGRLPYDFATPDGTRYEVKQFTDFRASSRSLGPVEHVIVKAALRLERECRWGRVSRDVYDALKSKAERAHGQKGVGWLFGSASEVGLVDLVRSFLDDDACADDLERLMSECLSASSVLFERTDFLALVDRDHGYLLLDDSDDVDAFIRPRFLGRETEMGFRVDRSVLPQSQLTLPEVG